LSFKQFQREIFCGITLSYSGFFELKLNYSDRTIIERGETMTLFRWSLSNILFTKIGNLW